MNKRRDKSKYYLPKRRKCQFIVQNAVKIQKQKRITCATIQTAKNSAKSVDKQQRMSYNK